MKQMVISTYSYRLQIEEYINERLKELQLEEYMPHINVEGQGKTTFVTCSFAVEIPRSKEQRYFKEYIITPVAKAIVDIIQKEFAIAYANEILQTSYGFREVVITDIIEDTMETKKLLDPIMTELIENNTLCLDGWIRFRLSQYKMHMIDRVENLTYEYEAYQEYEEFIALVKSFVLSQQSLIDQIHIIPSDNGSMDLYNENKVSIALNKERYDSQDDQILGTLLSLVPLQITIHQEKRCKNIKLIDTIESIYEGRVTFCKGCQDCEKPKLKLGFIRVIKDILTQKKL